MEDKLKIAKSAYDKQKMNNEREVSKLQDEIEALIAQREQLNAEYKQLYEKYQSILTNGDKWHFFNLIIKI